MTLLISYAMSFEKFTNNQHFKQVVRGQLVAHLDLIDCLDCLKLHTQMAEESTEDRKKQIREIYRYDEMSNRVLKADRRLQTIQSDPQRDAELSQPKSMSGRISAKEMGANARREATVEEREEARREVERRQRDTSLVKSNRSVNATSGTVLDSANLGLKYYPRDKANTEVYEDVLRWVSTQVGNDMPRDVIAGTADLLIYRFKDNEEEADGLVAKKRQEIEKELQIKVEPSEFQELVKLVKQITDYGDQSSGADEKVITTLSEDGYDEEELVEEQAEEDDVEEEEEDQEIIGKNIAEPILQRDDETLLLTGESSTDLQSLAIYDVDEFFIRRKLNEVIENADAGKIQRLSDRIMNELEKRDDNPRVLEESLMKMLDFEHLQLAEFVIKNRSLLLWGTRLARASEHSRPQLLQEMREKGLGYLVEQYESKKRLQNKRTVDDADEQKDVNPEKRVRNDVQTTLPPLIDLESLKFDEGAKLMTVTKVALPKGSYKKVNPHYEEIHIPAPERPEINYDLVSITSLPAWAQEAFPSAETETLNAIQSKVFPATFHDDINLLLCAPTGGGKTNVAMLSILRVISSLINPETKKLKNKNFKIVYLAPLKALVQEQVREFQRRLAYLDIKVEELTGDSNLSKYQISQTQILVSTPEKWDVITRKAADTSSFIRLVRLIIIDEVHLLHDQRGPVIESIVARSLQSEVIPSRPRIVGLSATLPNYEDVAKFLQVPPKGLFYFDSAYRPCPLSQEFCGVTEKNSVKRIQAANEACYDKTLQSVTDNHQVIIFVHSRKETARLAKYLVEKFNESGNSESLRKSDAGSKQVLSTEAENIQDPHLRLVLKYGIGLHHAGLSRSDRSLAEDLFADGVLQVLVSTATLAWGVNLPAHTVIIKGTDVYSPEKSTWDKLSPQDLLQMLGRAGRPRYDTHGEGIIITNQTDVQYYLAVLNQQLPIESQFISMLVDNLNAEIVSGNIKCRQDAVNWLSYTYLYVRMLVSPQLYKVPNDENDESLIVYRETLVHSALTTLHNENLIVYHPQTGTVLSTELGLIASYFYIKHTSMVTYSRELSDHSSQMDLFRIIAMSEEFKYLSVRPEERKELKELLDRAPVPVKENADDRLAKVNILLQSYISRLKLEGFALNADMMFITQNAGRISRALYEYSLKRGYSGTTKALLNICKMIDRRLWVANSPLGQMKSCPFEVVRKTEASTLPWQDYLELESPAQVGQAIRSEKHGKLVYDLLRRFPKLLLKCSIQPITPSLLKFELEILPDWIWDSSLHGLVEPFVVLVEDTDGENILFSSTLLVRKEAVNDPHMIDFTLQLSPAQQKRLPPNFFVSVISERWLNSDAQLALSIEHLRLPKKFPAPTPIIDMALVPTSELGDLEFSNVFNFELFNKFQSQTFQSVYNSNVNIMVGASKGAGKTTIAELALLNHWRQNKGRALYISPHQEKINNLTKSWDNRFSELAGGKAIGKLGIDTNMNLRIISQSHLVLATPGQFDTVSRRWRQKKNIQNIELIIYDDAHEISSGLTGAIYEAVISRMSFISTQLDKETRIVTLSSCVANGRDFGEWLGVNKSHIFNFSPQERINPIEIHLNFFNHSANTSYNRSMIKSAFDFAHVNSSSTTIVYLPTRLSCLKMSNTFVEMAESCSWDLLKVDDYELEKYLESLQDSQLRVPIKRGTGIIHKGMAAKDRKLIQKLYSNGALSVLFVARECCFNSPDADSVVILGTQWYDDKEHRFIDYTANEILEMVGNVHDRNGKSSGRLLLLTSSKTKDYYKKILVEALPLESFMYFHLPDLLVTEISTSVIESKQDCVDWLAYTYFYRRLHANPSFYGVKDITPYGISAYLTELVESTLTDLQNSSMIEIESQKSADEGVVSETISPLTGCMVSSHYNTSFLTMTMLLSSLSGSATLQDILHILSQASEFDSIPLREDELSMLRKLNERVPLRVTDLAGSNLFANKIFLLLQAHFSRLSLAVDFRSDLKIILEKAVPLVNTVIDVLSGDGKLNAMTAMDISQMIIQGLWDVDSPLKQIPYFDDDVLTKCSERTIETVYDIMALEDAEREEIMPSEDSKLLKIANFVNNYPNVELEYSIDQGREIKANEATTINLTLTRDELPETLEVFSEKYPLEKLETWWLVLGEVSSKQLHAIKKVSLRSEVQSYAMEFFLPEGEHELTIWCVCDSYLDVDKEVSFSLKAL